MCAVKSSWGGATISVMLWKPLQSGTPGHSTRCDAVWLPQAFGLLLDGRPAVHRELAQLRSTMQAAAGSEQLMQGNCTDLGVQAASFVMKAADPLIAMQELAQNFPLLMDDLAGREVDGRVR